MKFSKGDSVLAKASDSNRYLSAEVLDIKNSKYLVKFSDGSERTVVEDNVKVGRKSRSVSRGRAKRSGKSPGRKSPSKRSPARKSPSRSAKTTQSRKVPVRQARISLAKIDIGKDNSSDTDRTEESESVKDDDIEIIETFSSKRSQPQRGLRRSARVLSALKASQDRAVSLPAGKKDPYNRRNLDKERGSSIQEQDIFKGSQFDSDADVDSDGKERKRGGKGFLNKPQEWGGWIGALLLIFIVPLAAISLQIACFNGRCSSKAFRIPHYRSWKAFINLDSFYLFTGFLAFVAIISALPFGRLVDGQRSRVGRLQYRINGIWGLILTITGFAAAVYYNLNIVDFLIKKSLPLTVVAFLYGLIAAIALYIKGGKVPISSLNIYGTTNSRIYNFWQGREVNPRIGPLDIKLTLFRFALIATIMINVAIVFKIVKEPAPIDLQNPALPALIAASMQIFYCLDSIIFEKSFLSSFEITYEGTGYMLTTGYLMYPYFATVLPRFLLHNRGVQSVYILVLSILCFLGGYAIYRLSNMQKDQFRNNPYATSVEHLETIQTNRGKKLIVSGWWGKLRHPNYLGDILMHVSMAAVSAIAFDILPYVLAIELILCLVHRAVRDNGRCKQRYGNSWNEYCSRVKYALIKWVF